MNINRRKAVATFVLTSLIMTLVFVDLAMAPPTIPHTTTDGWVDPIDVTVENQGGFPETFGVTVYAETTVYIEPATVEVNVCDNFTVNINVANVTNLYAYEFKLTWDTSLINCIVCTPTPPWEPYLVAKDECNDTAGYYWLAVAALAPALPFNGSATLARCEFHCKGVGECVLDLYDTRLLDSSAEWVPTPPYLGDANGDLKVDIKDVYIVVKAYGSVLGEPEYDPNADFNNDTCVDLMDVLIVALNYGRVYPGDALLPVDNIIAHAVIDGYVIQHPPPQPHLEVFPTLIEYGPSPAVGEEFDISILIKDLAEEWQLVGIQFRLSYNSTLLQVVSVTEGSFLKDPRWNWYGTSFYSTVEPDGTYGPHVVVGGLLLPNATGHYDQTEFPNGDGTVATIRFRIIYQGVFPEVDISHLDLYDIGLIDKDSNPIPYEPPVNGTVTIIGVLHDIAIIDVSPSKTVVGQGYNITIHVTLQNQGGLAETFTVWGFCGFHKNITLPAYQSIIANYSFNTLRLSKGNYTTWAYVPPCFGDQDPYDNTYVGDSFTVVIPGDINADGKVNIVDIYLVIMRYGEVECTAEWHSPKGAPPNYTPNGYHCDITNDGKINIVDIYIAILHYGEFC